MKKKVITAIAAAVILFLIIPIPCRLKDGGSVEFRAITYTVTKYHQLDLNSETGYKDGLGVEIFGMEIYNSIE